MDLRFEFQNLKETKQIGRIGEKSLDIKFYNYLLVNVISVKNLRDLDVIFKVLLNIKPEKGQMLYLNGVSNSYEKSRGKTIKKLESQIKKYKEVHYSNSNKSTLVRVKFNKSILN